MSTDSELNIESVGSREEINVSKEDSRELIKCIRKGENVLKVDAENITMLKRMPDVDRSQMQESVSLSSCGSSQLDKIRSGESLYKTFRFNQSDDDEETDKCVAFWRSIMERNLKPIKCSIIKNRKEKNEKIESTSDSYDSANEANKIISGSIESEEIELNNEMYQDAPDTVWMKMFKEMKRKKLLEIKLQTQKRCKLCEELKEPSDSHPEKHFKEEVLKLNEWNPDTKLQLLNQLFPKLSDKVNVDASEDVLNESSAQSTPIATSAGEAEDNIEPSVVDNKKESIKLEHAKVRTTGPTSVIEIPNKEDAAAAEDGESFDKIKSEQPKKDEEKNENKTAPNENKVSKSILHSKSPSLIDKAKENQKQILSNPDIKTVPVKSPKESEEPTKITPNEEAKEDPTKPNIIAKEKQPINDKPQDEIKAAPKNNNIIAKPILESKENPKKTEETRAKEFSNPDIKTALPVAVNKPTEEPVKIRPNEEIKEDPTKTNILSKEKLPLIIEPKKVIETAPIQNKISKSMPILQSKSPALINKTEETRMNNSDIKTTVPVAYNKSPPKEFEVALKISTIETTQETSILIKSSKTDQKTIVEDRFKTTSNEKQRDGSKSILKNIKTTKDEKKQSHFVGENDSKKNVNYELKHIPSNCACGFVDCDCREQIKSNCCGCGYKYCQCQKMNSMLFSQTSSRIGSAVLKKQESKPKSRKK